MLVLRHIGPTRSQNVPMESRSLVVGRSPDCDIVIDEPRISDVVATFEPAGSRDECRLTCVARTGVQVNGKRRRTPGTLRPGDRVQIGLHVLVIDRFDDGAAAGPVAGSASFDHLKRFAEAVGREKDLRKLLQSIVRSLLKILGGTDAFIFKLDHEGKPEVFVSSADGEKPIEFSDTVVQQVLKTRQGVFIPHALSDPKYGKTQSINDLKLLSVLCCPIIIAEKISGVIYLGSRKATVSYGLADLEILSVYAAIAGMLVDHVEFMSQQGERIRRLARVEDQGGIVAESRIMKDVLRQADSAAESDMIALIEGETGTGKDLLAQHIHRRGARASKPFVVVNCGALQKDLLESELFGHRRGSFTGAFHEHRGLFRAADGGTLFLDEIGEMDPALQAKLLRTIETGKVRPVGSTSEEKVNVRLICATNRRLDNLVTEGTFREDLYFRLNQFRLTLPPLRERGDDAAVLAYYFLEKYRVQYPDKQIVDFHPDSLTFITLYQWPGNVRELASLIHRAVVTAQGPLVRVDVQVGEKNIASLEEATTAFQRKLVQKALDACGDNKDQAAKMLGIHRATLYRYLAVPA